jgi:hypothetical protein
MVRRFNHQFRNSLNGIKMGLYLFKREAGGPLPGCWTGLARLYEEIERSFDRLQMIYRPLSLTVVRSTLGLLISERLPSWRTWFDSDGRALVVERPDDDGSGDFDPTYLSLGLDAFVAWRAAQTQSNWHARLSWRIADGHFEIVWNDVPWRCGAAVVEHANGTTAGQGPSIGIDSLALPLLARIIEAHGGSVEARRDPAFRITLRWPRFQSGETAR